MQLTIFGTGYVGLVTGTCFAELGHEVVCMDVDKQKIDMLNRGGVPIYEPGLSELIQKNTQAKRLFFTTDAKEAIGHASILFIAVGTPPNPDGSANLSYVMSAAQMIGQHMDSQKIIVNKSTVQVGTAEKVRECIQKALSDNNKVAIDFDVASNPEFLKEGNAVRIEFTSTQGFHDWVLDEFNASTEKVSDSDENPTTVVEFVANKKGVFEYYCSVGEHRLNGMKGVFVVE